MNYDRVSLYLVEQIRNGYRKCGHVYARAMTSSERGTRRVPDDQIEQFFELMASG